MPGVIDVFGIIKVLLAKKSGITNRDAPKNLRGSLLLCILASLTERALLPSLTWLPQNACPNPGVIRMDDCLLQNSFLATMWGHLVI